MAIQVLDYSIFGFDSVPDFAGYLKKFDKINGGNLVRNQIGDLFRKHQMEKRLDLHKHWLLSGDGRATEIRDTSNPIPVDMNLAATPASWVFDPRLRSLHLVEFALSAQHIYWDGRSIQASWWSFELA